VWQFGSVTVTGTAPRSKGATIFAAALQPPVVCQRHAECLALAVENMIFSQLYLQIKSTNHAFCPWLMPHTRAASMMANIDDT
jgi:hypothetical protein